MWIVENHGSVRTIGAASKQGEHVCRDCDPVRWILYWAMWWWRLQSEVSYTKSYLLRASPRPPSFSCGRCLGLAGVSLGCAVGGPVGLWPGGWGLGLLVGSSPWCWFIRKMPQVQQPVGVVPCMPFDPQTVYHLCIEHTFNSTHLGFRYIYCHLCIDWST